VPLGPPPVDVAIVGGGIIGISCALALLDSGRSVTLVEPNAPGAGTAGGSAGYLSDGEIFPVAQPAVVRDLPRMLFDRDGPLVIRPEAWPTMLPWGLRFLAAARPSEVARGTAALAALNRLALEALIALATRAGAQRWLVRDGGVHVARDPHVLAHAASLIPQLAAYGLRAEPVDRAQLLRDEPALAPDIAGGIVYPDSARCTDPAAFGAALAARARADGMRLVRARVSAIVPHDGGWTVRTDGAPVVARSVVVAAGAWSAPLLAPLGYAVPLRAARGYHLMLPQPGIALQRTVLFEELHFCATPMDGGIRLAGTVEFAAPDAPPNPHRATMLLALAQRYLPALRADGATSWMGARPAFPDSRPAIEALARHPGLVVCTGHEKLGLTQAGISARCVAALIARRPPPVDLTPFALTRF
jgi:D-amino-acid dehydrogenase